MSSIWKYKLFGGNHRYEGPLPEIGSAIVVHAKDGVHDAGTYEVIQVIHVLTGDSWVEPMVVITPREDMWWQ